MLNTNLDLNIKEYVCVDFVALLEVIDALGGIEIDIKEWEYAKEINDMNFCLEEYINYLKNQKSSLEKSLAELE